jgi:AraC family transcriptional regulator
MLLPKLTTSPIIVNTLKDNYVHVILTSLPYNQKQTTMYHSIKMLTEKKLAGKHLSMSFANNKTGGLWGSFMPHRKEIKNNIGTDLFSLQIYPSDFFESFNPHAVFEKWAAIEVTDIDNMPDGMQSFILPGGLYAVFLYRASEYNAQDAFRYIFETWLPTAAYTIDDRPHFEVLGEKYKKDDPTSEEEIWIPVKPKH